MKIILSILLSFTLLTTGLPIPGQASAGDFPEPELATEGQEETGEQEEAGEQKKEDANAPKEGDRPAEEAPGGTRKETEPPGLEEEGLQEKAADIKDPEGKSTGKKEETKQEPEMRESAKTKKEGGRETGKEGESLKLENYGIRAAGQEEISQDTDKKKIVLDAGETVAIVIPLGYHLEEGRKIKCIHTADSINAGVKCKKAANPLNPTENELKNNVELTGKLKGKKYTRNIIPYDDGGLNNTVTHLRMSVKLDAPGIEDKDYTLATNYVCADGYAAYAYFVRYFSYCPNTEKFYYTGSAHVWLGCTKGDAGTKEDHPEAFQHTFQVYKQVPNKYTVSYDANGGTGTASKQSAVYNEQLRLRSGANLSREGYTLAGWNTKKNGSGTAYKLKEDVTNLTDDVAVIDNKTITLYAQWKPNTLEVKYNANGGEINTEKANKDIATLTHSWSYGKAKTDPVNFGAFGLSRTGYARKDGAEWNTKADGSGRSFDQDIEYEMTDYAPNLTTGNRKITLYAQWEPKTYTVTLDNRLEEPDTAGTEKIYKKYEAGIFLDEGCSKAFTPENPITLPEKARYKFKGYYSESGEKMIGGNGTPEAGAISRKNAAGNETWHARYAYLVGCEDYADVPCDMEKADGETREDTGARLTYDSGTRKVTAITAQAGCSITLTGQPAGTEIGEFKSAFSANSASGNTGTARSAELPITILEGTAYRLEVAKGDETICDRLAYYKDGRFRTLVKLGEQEAREAEEGSSLAGSAWGTDEAYSLYQYHGCSELEDIKAPGTAYRYFRYKDVNMAYSGNGATEGRNTLEYDVSLEDMYQFRDNGFKKEATETKHTEDEEAYECTVKYSFQGWKMKLNSFAEKDQYPETEVYGTAEKEGVISDHTTEDIRTYEEAEPIPALPGLGIMNLPGNARGAQAAWEAYAAAAPEKAHAEEYINLTAKWDACPTIVVTPGDRLEFYEGEEVTKEMLTSHLTAHDNEDNNRIYPDMNDRLRIIKISYPEPENHSQAAYEKTYDIDVPEGFLLDTYYLKLEEDESVDVLITFAVTDSAGNTTEEELPAKVKYNHYPEISSEDTFYYLKEEANRGEITEAALLGRASAEDMEDGDITGNLLLPGFDAQEVKMQTESKAEFSITYQVTDAYRKTTYKTVKVMVWDEDAAIAEMPKYYVRYISEKYLDTLEENSTWREPENMEYLKSILRNETPLETWAFTHEDVLAVQDWITEGGDGNWKIGQAANREFLVKFAHCRQ